MTTREVWYSPENEREWLEFWNEFFNGEASLECGWKNDEKRRHREKRRLNRMHKKRLVNKNKQVIEERIDRVIRAKKLFDIPREEVKVKRYSLYRLRENGKNCYPLKPIPKRTKNFFLKMISDFESSEYIFDNESYEIVEKESE